MKKLLLLTSFLVTLTFYAQNNPDFYLADNGGTCMCPEAEFGDTGTLTINGETKTFTKRSRAQLDALIDNDEQDPYIALTCTSGIDDMSFMFIGATSFDQPLNNWDVSNVTTMFAMFKDATSFNQSLDNWDVSNVTDMAEMFSNTTSFNQPLNNWDVSQVTDMRFMFYGAESFGQPLNNWDVSNVTTIRYMFYGAESFDQPLNNWDVSQVTDMQLIFGDATSFNQPLDNWDVSQVTNMFAMFSGATSFNQPLNNWDVNNVTDMYGMFYGAESFDQPLNNWDVSQVTNMRRMFEEASSFNQPLDNWDVSQVTNMIGMFTSATAANPDVSNWDVSSVGRMRNMFEDSNLSIENLTSIYENWSLLTLQQNVSFSAGTIKYNESGQAAGQAGRDIITDTYNWSISDGGVVVRPFIIEVDSNKSGVSNNDQFQFTGAEGNYDVVAKQNNIVVATFNDLSGEETITLPSSGVYVLEVRDKEVNGFNRIAFNFGGDEDKIKDIKQWGTIVWSSFESAFSGCSNMLVTATDVPVLSSVTNMQSMFWSATSANPNTSNWDVSSVTNMRSMFNNTLSANPDTKNWNVSSVTNMQNMFSRATSANPDVSNWDVSSVTTMFVMFDGATAANPNTSNWDVSSVTRMDLMFSDATSANPDTSNWDVSNVTNMRGMFSSASSFNQPLDNWDVSHVTDMEFMFNDALSFNQDISNWCVEQIPNEPQDFAVNSALQNNFFPNWGAECNLSTTNPEAIGFNILIYPNPSNSKVFIENDGQIILSKIKLIDMLGRDIKTLSASQITHGLDVSGIDAGNYFVQFTTVNDQQFVKRLIVK